MCSALDPVGPEQNSEMPAFAHGGAAAYRLRALTLEARYNDIPIPLGSEPIPDFFAQDPVDDQSIIFGYTNSAEPSQLFDFFKNESIRLGWHYSAGMQSIESLLVLEKPDRVCTMSLRPLDGTTALIISLSPKDSEIA